MNYLFRTIVLFSFLSFLFQKSFAQTDTSFIKAYADSCRWLNTSEEKIFCGENLLKLIQENLSKTKSEKERVCFEIAESNVLRNTGNAYKDMGMTSKAMEYYQKSKEKAEHINYKRGLAAALLNSGIIYQEIAKDTADNKKALLFFDRSLKVFEEINDKKGIGLCWGSLGITNQNLGEYKLALKNFEKSISVFEDIEDKSNLASSYRNVGYSYEKLKEYELSFASYQKSLSMFEELGDSSEIGLSLAGIGNIYQLKGNFKKAEEYYSHVLQIAKKMQDISTETEALKAVRDIYRKQGRYKEALDINDDYMVANQSNIQKQKIDDIAKMIMQNDFDKKESSTKAKHEKQIAIEEEEKKQQRIIIFSVIGGLILVIVFSIFILNRWRLTQRQKKIIEIQKGEVEQQKKLVEDHQKEIIDSITYAKRLQEAILPPLAYVNERLPDNFILYKPKDIVAGDFYWMEELDNIIFIAAADCTGHGVPGAMVSVVCSNALNRTVKEFNLRDTGKILDKVTELVLETFEKSDKDVKDGMDISLIAIHKNTGQINWSGANNPLLYIPNSADSMTGSQVIKIAADKQPVGKHDNRKPFTTNTVSYLPDSIFYLFTDGYADQFGGPKGKKFMFKKMQATFMEICKKPMDEQKKILDQTIEDWKGRNEQVDDICVIGIRV